MTAPKLGEAGQLKVEGQREKARNGARVKRLVCLGVGMI